MIKMNLNEFKVKLNEIIDNNRIIEDQARAKDYSKDYHYPLIQSKFPNIIVIPEALEEIQQIIKLANIYKIPIIPKSSRLSRYGGTIAQNGGLILDLQKMNQIIKIDDANMHVIIEPGVTFKQLQNELDKYNLRILPTIFSSSDSVISSYLARYPSYTMPKFEFTDLVVNIEVVLGNGEIFRTGSMASANSPPVYPYGSSLDFFRIFHGARGGLGIITKASIRIKPKPKIQEILSIPFEKYEDFIKFVYEIERREIGIECLILNKCNALQFLSTEYQNMELPNWILLICLEGPQRFPEDKITYEKEAIYEVLVENSIEVKKTEIISRLENEILKQFNSPDEKSIQYYDLPLYLPLNSFSNVYSAILNHLKQFYKHNIDLGISIIPVERNRVVYVEFDLYTEINEEKQVNEFKKLFKTLGEVAISSGAVIDIPYGPLKDVVYKKIDDYSSLINDIKNIFDPDKIMNPGQIEWSSD
jgi:FAD/FMN-containing dehydrogenase